MSKTRTTVLVRAASAVRDIFNELNLPTTLPHCHVDEVRLHFHTSRTIPAHLTKWIFNSVLTLRPMYEASIIGWDADEKWRDLYHSDQRFIIASHPDFAGEFAFLSFRWDVEDRLPVMYIYELFVNAAARGKRVALALMWFAERLCVVNHIHCIMLTVFNDNTAALKLYRDSLQ